MAHSPVMYRECELLFSPARALRRQVSGPALCQHLPHSIPHVQEVRDVLLVTPAGQAHHPPRWQWLLARQLVTSSPHDDHVAPMPLMQKDICTAAS